MAEPVNVFMSSNDTKPRSHSSLSFGATVERHASFPNPDEGRRVSAWREPVPFEAYERGVYLHGTKADLAVGDLLVPGRESNFEAGRVMNYVYFTGTLDAAVWGA
jgi:hypothetical protein